MKIGIFLYPLIFPKYTIDETIRHYCLKYNLDDAIPVAFKGTDKNMCCRKFKYNIGRNEDSLKVRPIELCSSGLHSCWELDAVFDYYPFNELELFGEVNRYFIALNDGPVKYGVVKMCSNVLIILKEIPRDMAYFYHEELRNGKQFHEAIMHSGLYDLVNYAINEFIANNKDGNDYVNIISYDEGGDWNEYFYHTRNTVNSIRVDTEQK